MARLAVFLISIILLATTLLVVNKSLDNDYNPDEE